MTTFDRTRADQPKDGACEREKEDGAKCGVHPAWDAEKAPATKPDVCIERAARGSPPVHGSGERQQRTNRYALGGRDIDPDTAAGGEASCIPPACNQQRQR